MRQRILKALTYNIGFKVLALVLAFILWLVVYNIEDPDKTASYTITVTIQNEDAVAEQNKYFEIISNTTVNFAVTAKRSILDQLEDADFSAIADMSDMTISEDGTTGSVPIALSCSRYGSQVKFTNRTKTLEVSLEDTLTRQFVISASTTGEVADGYALGTVTIQAPNVLKVTGPKSLVESIDRVEAVIDVDGMSLDISDNVLPTIYDRDGKVVDSSKLTLSNSTVTVSASILGTKEVPLKFATTGSPAGDNSVIGVESDPETITIKGHNSVLNQISSITIDNLNVENADGNIETDINVTEYLPDGTELVDQNDATIHVTIEIQVYEEITVNLPTAGLEVIGLSAQDTLSYTLSTVSVTLEGAQEDLQILSADMIRGSIDVTGLSHGTHTTAVTLELDASRYTYKTVSVEVVIKSKKS